jgi:hypothetical protein
MRLRACSALLLQSVACVTTEPRLKGQVAHNPRRANHQRATAKPRKDERQCPVVPADAATVETMVGICRMAQPELVVVGATIQDGSPQGRNNGFSSPD